MYYSLIARVSATVERQKLQLCIFLTVTVSICVHVSAAAIDRNFIVLLRL